MRKFPYSTPMNQTSRNDRFSGVNFSLNQSWLNEVTAPLPNQAAKMLTTYQPADRLIHPCMIEVPYWLTGHQYICAITSFINSGLEDPFVYGANDPSHWELLNGPPQPLDTKPPAPGGLNSDTFAVYDEQMGELIVGYRAYAPRSDDDRSVTNSDIIIKCRTTTDGQNWSDIKEIFRIPADENIFLSPSVVLDPLTRTWHMWTIHRPVMHHWTAPDLYGPWTLDDQVVDTSPFDLPHHHEMKWVGDRLVCLLYARGDGNLYFGQFEKGSWTKITWGVTGVLTPRPASLYKASFIPVYDQISHRMAFDIWWTTGARGQAGGVEQNLGRKLQYARTNTVTMA